MNRFFSSLTLVLSLNLMILGCFSSKPKAVRPIGPLEAMGQIRNDFAVLVDVRDAGSNQTQWIENSIRIQRSVIFSDSFKNSPEFAALPKNKKLIVFGTDGIESGEAAKKLSELGFESMNMGTIKDWKDAKLPVAESQVEGKKP